MNWEKIEDAIVTVISYVFVILVIFGIGLGIRFFARAADSDLAVIEEQCVNLSWARRCIDEETGLVCYIKRGVFCLPLEETRLR